MAKTSFIIQIEKRPIYDLSSWQISSSPWLSHRVQGFFLGVVAILPSLHYYIEAFPFPNQEIEDTVRA